MGFEKECQARVDEEGRLILSPAFLAHYGLKPGVEVRIEDGVHGLKLNRPITQLSKVYVEPTNRCNLECRTCIRNVWDEPLGEMSSATFGRIVEGLRSFSPPPTVFFGGANSHTYQPFNIEICLR